MEKIIEPKEDRIMQEKLDDVESYQQDLIDAEEKNLKVTKMRRPHLGLLVTGVLILGTLIGFAVGYGSSHIIPDEDLRKNTINSHTADGLLYLGDAKPEGVVADLQRGYTKEQIENNYLLQPSKTDLPGVETAKGIESPVVQKSLLNDNYVYTGTGVQPGALTLPVVTDSYFKKSDYETGKIYEPSSGTGATKTLTDVSTKYIKKPEGQPFSSTGLYRTTGTAADTTLSGDVSGAYISKDTTFLVKGYENYADKAGTTRSNGALVALDGGYKAIRKYYRIYDSLTGRVSSIGFTNIGNGETKTLYLVAPVAIPATTTPDDFTPSSTETADHKIALIEMAITNTAGTLSGKFTKTYLAQAITVAAITENFAAWTPQRILDEANQYQFASQTATTRAEIDISTDVLSFLFQKLT